MKKKVKLNKLASIILLVLSGLVLLYFFYVAYISMSYIGSLMNQGKIGFGKDFGQILQYIMTNTMSYLFYSIVFAFIAYTIKKQSVTNIREEESVYKPDSK